MSKQIAVRGNTDLPKPTLGENSVLRTSPANFREPHSDPPATHGSSTTAAMINTAARRKTVATFSKQPGCRWEHHAARDRFKKDRMTILAGCGLGVRLESQQDHMCNAARIQVRSTAK